MSKNTLSPVVTDALDRLDALLNPDLKLLAVPYNSATARGCRQDLDLLKCELLLAQERDSAAIPKPMSLLDVLNILKGNNDYWFRPVGWRGLGRAFTFQNGMIIQVPDPHGNFAQGLNLLPAVLLGEWEITNAMTVCRELEDDAIQPAGAV